MCTYLKLDHSFAHSSFRHTCVGAENAVLCVGVLIFTTRRVETQHDEEGRLVCKYFAECFKGDFELTA